MSPPPAGTVTQMLQRWRSGDVSALDQMIPLVHAELRRLAHRSLRGERGRELQTADLLNEAYLRLVDAREVQWHDRAHFFAVAVQLMRRVLVDEARRRNVRKRGGDLTRITLDETQLVGRGRDADLVALDEALEALARFAPRKCRVVELRFYAGLTIPETAAVLGVSTDVVKRELRTAKLWLLEELEREPRQRGPYGPAPMGAD